MELLYIAEMQKNELSLNDLPEDAKTGIENIKDIQKALTRLEKSGKSPTVKTLNKIKALDKWITYEILDLVNDTEKNTGDGIIEKKEIDKVIEDIDKQVEDPKEATEDPKEAVEVPEEGVLGISVEVEIKTLYDAGIKQIDIEDLRTKAPKCYDILFDTYDPSEDNGIETSYYSIIEGKDDDLFHIKKN